MNPSVTSTPVQRNSFEWLTAATVLYVATIATQLLSLPLETLRGGPEVLGASIGFLTLLTLPSIAIGLHYGRRLGLVPGLASDASWFYGSLVACIAGLTLGGVLLLTRLITDSYVSTPTPELGFRGIEHGLRVSLGAAVGEEVWFRLGLMTLLFWWFGRGSDNTLSTTRSWTIIVVVGVLFGAAHLPQLNAADAATSLGMTATVLGNTLVSLLFGWCYWRYSLGAAIVAHFSVDIMLHVLSAFML